MSGMTQHPTDRPETPRSEPEILPPGTEPRGRAENPFGGHARGETVFVTVDREGRTRYATFKPPGPFSIALGVVVIGLIAAAILFVALGFVLFWVPVIAIVIAGLAFSGYLRGAWRSLTGR